MLRILLEIVVPFLAPFFAYFLWRFLTGPGRGILDRCPWYALTVAGLLLVAASLASLALLPGESPDTTYVPPHMEDGRLVPGRFVPRPHPP
jgi:hypothetical protein